MSDDRRRRAIQGIGQAVFGQRWQAPLASSIGYSSQHLNGVMSGKYPVSDDLVRKVLEWTKKIGLPAMKERYKALYSFQVDLALIEAEKQADEELEMILEAPQQRM